jgi:NADPH-dependent ferric siderophore reductase
MNSKTTDDAADDASFEAGPFNGKILFPLKNQCSRIEQRLLRGLRGMTSLRQSQLTSFATLESLGMDRQGIFHLAQLRSIAVSMVPQLRFLEPDSEFVCLDELDLLASLNRLMRTMTFDVLRHTTAQETEHPMLMALHDVAVSMRRAGLVLRQVTPAESLRRMLEQEVMRADRRRVNSLKLFTVSISQVRDLSPHIRRITLSGACLTGYLSGMPAQWVKLFAPMGLGDLGDVGRAYTIRHYRPHLCEVDIDVSLLDSGPLSRWAASAWVGQALRMSDARGGYAIADDIEWMLLAGDMSAVPAIATILEALPENVRAKICVDVRDVADLSVLPARSRTELHWSIQGHGARAPRGTLLALIRAVGIPPGAGRIWVAAEHSSVASIRKHAISDCGQAAERVHHFSYWKRGKQEFKDMAVG